MLVTDMCDPVVLVSLLCNGWPRSSAPKHWLYKEFGWATGCSRYTVSAGKQTLRRETMDESKIQYLISALIKAEIKLPLSSLEISLCHSRCLSLCDKKGRLVLGHYSLSLGVASKH